MLKNEYFHNFSGVLNFTDEMQHKIDDAVIIVTEKYMEYITRKVIYPKYNQPFNFHDSDYTLNYAEYCLNLIFSGIAPDLLDILVQNIYDEIMDSIEDKGQSQAIRLQLLFVKKAIKILHLGISYHEQYLLLINQIASNRVDYVRYETFFNNLKKKLLP